MEKITTLRVLSRGLRAPLLALLLCGVTPAEAADRPAVSIGEVSVLVDATATGEAAPELSRALRATLKDELSKAAGLARAKQPLIVSATLTRLSIERRDDRTKTTANISLALMRADDQVLFAELRGRASVEESSGNLATQRRAALQGAVRGALARLAEAVQRSR
jgi:hypothetical protein